MKQIGRLSIITDTAVQARFSHFQLAEMAVKAGADMIQFRDKNIPTDEMIAMASAIKKLCKKYSATLIINDRVDVAMISDADGVHLGTEDLEIEDARKLLGKSKIIGSTAHSLKEALQSEKNGADYIGFGHIFTTESKTKSHYPKGIAKLSEVCRRIKVPVIAIGGINEVNAPLVLKTGVHGIAVIGAVAKAVNPYAAVRNLKFCLTASSR